MSTVTNCIMMDSLHSVDPPDVALEVGFLVGLVVTHGAGVEPGGGVGVAVLAERRAGGEALGADLADVGALTGVQADMVTQVRGAGEAGPAELADMGSLVCMLAYVFDHVKPTS